MKYVIIIPDGAADFPISELKNKTPLEASNIPNINFLTKNGCTGLVQTSYHKYPVGSIVANMAILGYDPTQYYPNGRASFEALAKGINLKKNDVAFRCNLISLNGEIIKDFTADNISDKDASNIIKNFKIQNKNFELHFGMSYRHTLVIRNARFSAHDLNTFEPHMNIGKNLNKLLIKTKKFKLQSKIDELNDFLLNSIQQIKELNKKFNTEANMLWLWSASSTPYLPNFSQESGLSGGAVCGMDFLKGIAKHTGMYTENIPNTNGYINTNLQGKFETAKRYIQKYDLTYIHINSPDEEAHKKNPYTKIKAIELIDQKIVGPIYNFLKENYKEFRIAILPDHYTLTKDGTHNNQHVPYCIYGTGITPDQTQNFHEREIENNNNKTVIGHEFIKNILQQ